MCLLRGVGYYKTLIIQEFDSYKMTGGLSGYLHQEFCRLELLNEITKLHFEQTLLKKK